MIAILLFVLVNGQTIAQNRYDVVISEIMADPNPPVGLPAYEWIELKNASNTSIQLQGWKLGDGSGPSSAFPSFELLPDSSLIICSVSAQSALSQFGRALSVSSFPSLDNDGELIYLRSQTGNTIHAVEYSSEWYRNEIKKDGGWSLEMIDSRKPCLGKQNWKATEGIMGGTPGKNNSSQSTIEDREGPGLINAYSVDSITLILVFDEPIDSIFATNISQYTISNGNSIREASPIAPLFNKVQLRLSEPLSANSVYQLKAMLKDCAMNTPSAELSIKVGVPSVPEPAEWIINEILFNPRPTGADYVEFFNNSNKIFDASKLSIANRNSTGAVSNIKSLSVEPFYVYPGEYFAVTEDLNAVLREYFVQAPRQVNEISSLPSLPDEQGSVITSSFLGTILDELHYHEDWHFKLLANREGIALERIDPLANTQDAGNWHSAASTSAFGTPGYKNSQFQVFAGEQAITISPKVFSPDNDGRDDFATLRYHLDQSGYIANIIIFNQGGIAVRILVKNALLGVSGQWTWDGLDEKGKRLPMGIYIFHIEFFNLQGKKQVTKKAIALASPLK